jgi:hypothetical protein
MPPRPSTQYIFYYPDWQLVSDHAKFCLDSDPLILGISEAIRQPPGARSEHLSAQTEAIWAEMGANKAAPHQIELPGNKI